jgi:hypothetical protein
LTGYSNSSYEDSSRITGCLSLRFCFFSLFDTFYKRAKNIEEIVCARKTRDRG